MAHTHTIVHGNNASLFCFLRLLRRKFGDFIEINFLVSHWLSCQADSERDGLLHLIFTLIFPHYWLISPLSVGTVRLSIVSSEDRNVTVKKERKREREKDYRVSKRENEGERLREMSLACMCVKERVTEQKNGHKGTTRGYPPFHSSPTMAPVSRCFLTRAHCAAFCPVLPSPCLSERIINYSRTLSHTGWIVAGCISTLGYR